MRGFTTWRQCHVHVIHVDKDMVPIPGSSYLIRQNLYRSKSTGQVFIRYCKLWQYVQKVNGEWTVYIRPFSWEGN